MILRYNDFNEGITATDKYLIAFLENLILGAKNELRNRYMHVDYVEPQSATEDNSKCKNCTLDEAAIPNTTRERQA